MREANIKFLPQLALREQSGGVVETLPAFMVNAKPMAKVSERTARAVEGLFTSKRSAELVADVVLVSNEPAMDHSLGTSLIAEFSLPFKELVTLKNGYKLEGFGTIYPDAGVRWRVDMSNRYLTRVINSEHGHLQIAQRYTFRGWADIKQTVFVRPLERFASKFDFSN